MSELVFVKMEGAGNDYIYIEADRTDADWTTLVPWLSDRHFGIGGDGVILIAPSKVATARMVMFNADGSEGAMCGNGVRCIAHYLHERGRASAVTSIETVSGVVKVRRLDTEGDRYEVAMGLPHLEPDEVPVAAQVSDGGFVRVSLELADQRLAAVALSMGNPHAVTFWPQLDGLDLDRLGPAIEHHHLFPEGVNVSFAQVLNRGEVALRVWERGAGETLACGSGACATVVAAALSGLSERQVTVHARGGDLAVRWESDSVYLAGPARTVFSGTVTI
ncbi:MAG: diaminopimelate epimerase [Sulfobacillus sp.]